MNNNWKIKEDSISTHWRNGKKPLTKLDLLTNSINWFKTHLMELFLLVFSSALITMLVLMFLMFHAAVPLSTK